VTIVGIGVDSVDVERFRRVLRRRPGFAARIFTLAEQADAAVAADPAERLAARFAAKEAALKALGRGIGAVAFREVEVVRAAGAGAGRGAPSLRLGERAAALAADRGATRWHVSLTHTATVATALVVAEAPDAAAAPGAPG
jgi:holo-[acyl-carrier protein] synthase